MLTNHTISTALKEIAFLLKHDLHESSVRQVERNQRTYLAEEFPEFKRDLTEAGHQSRIIFMDYAVSDSGFPEFLAQQDTPSIVFIKDGDVLKPVIVTASGKRFHQLLVDDVTVTKENGIPSTEGLFRDASNAIVCIASLAYNSPVSDHSGEETHMTPVKRLWRLLATEKNEIAYVFFYAGISGLVSLVLPLGIQTTVELVTGGVIFSSVYVMIGLVIIGTILSGSLQIVQISMVEFLQRRVFAKAAFEFAFRIPRLKMEALSGRYTPELINRFFDVVTIQKGLPKLLIDLSSAAIQILFGLMLISLYHPFFVFFGLALIGLLTLIFFLTGPRGLSSSLEESKYKYRVVQWLEELARTMQSFKLGGSTDHPLRQTDHYVNNYLKYRKKHFGTLLTQFSFILFFKAAIIGCLLIVGTLLVIRREITIGQFVASELVIILILNAVEKIIMYIDVVYDMLAAVDKVAHVTDLPVERVGGLDLPRDSKGGFRLTAKNLTYAFPGSDGYNLGPIHLQIEPGEHLGICGPGDSGKTLLSNIMAGLYLDYKGILTLDQYSMNDLDLTHLRESIGKNISSDDLFEGTLLDNLTVGNTRIQTEHVLWALEKVGLSDFVNSLPKGLETPVVSSGKGLGQTTIQKLILARCLTKKPRLIVLNHFFATFTRKEKLSLLRVLTDPAHHWTLIIVSNDPVVLAAMDRVLVLDKGVIRAEGTFEHLLSQNSLQDLVI
ncbi:MAG: ATP-binding cassette domain-containing protein [Bacteroidetes bacterium]|nr:ATP-binding cassette domain-containing protein [Bacteroidota bacterium]